MTDTATLQALLARIESAAGPSVDLDEAIALDVGTGLFRSRRTASGVNKGREWLVDSHGGAQEWARHPPAYTASIDEALALVERLLPEYGVQTGHPIKKVRDWGWYASVFRERRPGETGWWPGHYSGGTDDEGKHLRYYPTAPLAILAALLKALIANDA